MFLSFVVICYRLLSFVIVYYYINHSHYKSYSYFHSNSWRNDLQHPNEFVRGATLRFLCHLREPELLEPLMPSVRSCLVKRLSTILFIKYHIIYFIYLFIFHFHILSSKDHEHSYVRKNAINAISTIYKHLDYLIPDAPELIESLLSQESDVSCQKFAFIFLSQTEPLRAVNYFNLIAERVAEMDGSLQLAVIEFIQQAFQSTTIINDQNSEMSSKFFKVLLGLLKKSSSSGAKFESACTLISYSESTEIIKSKKNDYFMIIITLNCYLIIINHHYQ